MNVHLPQPRTRALLFPAIFFLGIVSGLSAQGGACKNLVTAISTGVADTLSGVNLVVSPVNPGAQNGDVNISILQPGGSGNPFIYKISYLPDPGFTGTDTFAVQLIYAGGYPYSTYRAYRVSVYPSLLTCRPDFAVTTSNTPVAVSVLTNDSGTNPPLTVTALPSVKNGTATVNAANEVEFTPTPGFTGVAQVEYIVCDAMNTCKKSQISIGVNNNPAPSSDTIHIAAAKNTRINIPLTFGGYSLYQSPAGGSVTVQSGQYFSYTPKINFTGSDQFILSNDAYGPTVYKTVILDVVNTPVQNTLAMDDYVFTLKDEPITFNVRDNDIGNLLVKNWLTPPGFPGSLSGTLSNGKVTFTPNPGFSGVAAFQYCLGNGQTPDIETATVNVIVGNLNPTAGSFDLTTPKSTQIVVNHQIPLIGHNFSITDAPDNGYCAFFPGYSTQNINGKTISGFNLLVYKPNEGFIGTDEFEINYCVVANGLCQSAKIVMNVLDVISSGAPYCFDDCVWPGDVNRDGIVNNKDLLPMGYFMGLEGLPRENASAEFTGQYADNWNNPLINSPLDVKHADTNGDGKVTAADTTAISQFYNQQHNIFPNIPPTSKDLPFSFKVLTPNPGIGDLVEVEVSLGNSAEPITNLYGFTFDVSLSPTIRDSAFRMTYYNDSWLNTNAASLWMGKSPRQGRLETAFTRAGINPVSGYGVIGKFEFIVIDIIHGAKPEEKPAIRLNIDNPLLLQGNGYSTSGGEHTIEIPLRSEPQTEIQASDSDFFVYPSPADELLRVHLNGDDLIKSLSIFDATGRMVYNSGDVQWEHTELNISELQEGFYVASARTTSGNVLKKFQVLR